jgi:hypothetical protein
MKKDPHDLERLNKMISPYQGPGWAATSRPEKERMRLAVLCIEKAEAYDWS